MAKSKEDIKYGTAQARLSEDEAVRVKYVHGTPLEGGKIADSEPVDLFSSAHNIPQTNNNNYDNKYSAANSDQISSSTGRSQQQRQPGGNTNNTTTSR
ncbi:Seed maturation protein [Melia azedarach]|uniref:Seed maturation protein n=1 Tax=Melia azedarach TaxID=155640 RepID=A0ACC1YTF3_MELAZ|nr:Seed maturation protein [Melia azedarach]